MSQPFCSKCKKRTDHRSGLCAKCRSKKCARCKKDFTPVKDETQHCSACKKLLSNREVYDYVQNLGTGCTV